MTAESAQDRDALAGEYALSLLDERDSTAVGRRMASEPELAASVAYWRERMLELDASAPATAPSPDLWPRIDATIATAERPTVAAPERARPSWVRQLWLNLGLWRGVGLVGATASVALAIGLGAALREAGGQPAAIAVLVGSDARPGAIVEVYSDGSSYVARLADVDVPDGRAMQVWTLPDAATGPKSIGLIRGSGGARLEPVALPPPRPSQFYEITLEPSGGSPTGRPTGPVLFKGYAEAPR